MKMPRAIGWLVTCFPDRDRNGDWCEPMSFGRPDEPHPEMLLRRHRFMAFESHEEAKAALRDTLRWGDEQGCQWVRKYVFSIQPIEMHSGAEAKGEGT